MTHQPLPSQPSRPVRLLVVDDHTRSRESVALVLRHAGYEVDACGSAAHALALLREDVRDVVITDLQMPGMDGLEFIREIERLDFACEVLMITAHASIATAVEAMRHGAFDYLEKPFDAERLEQAVANAAERKRLAEIGRGDHGDREDSMIGEGAAMRSLRQQIAQISPTDETVLICGESGTGKELVARAIHAASQRSEQEFVSLNCPVLSEQLTESELFGHRRGAFTGADTDRVGRFELAQGGTLLLDEITEINLHLQAKLLRVLQERTFEPVGSSESVKADVRVLATTNRNLPEEITAGRFREDLYYRLAVVPIELPPLRQRREDIPRLAEYFVQCANGRLGRAPRVLEPVAMELLAGHDWPGNIRELQNVVTRACILSEEATLFADKIRPWLTPRASHESPVAELPAGEMSLAQMERQMILSTLRRFDGHRSRTAKALGIGVRTLSSKLRSYGVAPREKELQEAC